MRVSNNPWSPACGTSSSLRHNYGSPLTRTQDATDLFLVSRRFSGRELSRQYVVALLSVQADSATSWRSLETQGAFVQFFYLESVKPFQPVTLGTRYSKPEKRTAVCRAVTEAKDAVVRGGPRLLKLRSPCVRKTVEVEPVVVSYREGFEAAIQSPRKVKHSPKVFKQTTIHLRNSRDGLPHHNLLPRRRTSEECHPRVDAVISALKQSMQNKRFSVDSVMEHYKDISKTDISGILTELQERHDLQGTLDFFRWMKKQPWYYPNSRQYTRLIGFFGREGEAELACLHLQGMLLERCKPDQYTFTAMLNAFGKSQMYDDALAVFSHMKESQDPNCKPNTVTCNALVDALVRGGHYELAIKTFIDMKEGKNGLDSSCEPNVVTYNILFDALCKEGHVELAVQGLYHMSKGDSIPPNVATYNTLINACGKCGLYDKAEELMEHMVEHGHKADRITYTALIDAYGKAGICESAENMFKGMRGSDIKVDVMAYTAMIDAYARAALHGKAEDLFQLMCDSGVQPNQVTYLALMEAYGKSGLPLEAKKVFLSMQKEGHQANVLHHSALIDAYGKAGHFHEAADVYKMMKRRGCQPNLITFAAILASASKCKSWVDAKVLIMCLKGSDRKVESALYGLLMKNENSWDEAFEVLEQVRESKQLRKSLYNALMDFLWQFEMKERAAKVVAIAKKQGIYVDEYHKEEWNLDLHGLSVGGAMVGLLTWLNELHSIWLWDEDVPSRLRVITGKGKHSRTKISSLKSPVQCLLLDLASPFSAVEEEYGGYLVASGESVRAWLQEPGIKQKLQLTDAKNLFPLVLEKGL